MAHQFKFSKRSIDALLGVHPDLIAVARLGLKLSPYDFVITEGLRTESRQRDLVQRGKSRTMNSKHLTGDAFDFAVIVDGEISWDIDHYKPVADQFKRAAKYLGVDIAWGGDWKSFIDCPHIQRSVS